jgi:hypothetical protein
LFETLIEFAQNVVTGILWVAGGSAVAVGILSAVYGIESVVSWAVKKLAA